MKSCFKSILLILFCFIFIFSACSCGSNVDENGYTKIYFNQSNSDLAKLDGAYVTISGYLSLLSPLDGTLVYLMNLPLQNCPYCVPNSTTLSNTIAVEMSNINFDFTTDPVKITGKLVLGDFVDGYGYSYSFKIIDGDMTVIDGASISKDYVVYYTLSENGYVYKLYDAIMCIDMYVYHEMYDIPFSTLTPINFFDYEAVRETVKEFDGDDYYDFIAMWDEAYDLIEIINDCIATGDSARLSAYNIKSDVLYNSFMQFINRYSL